ncbi:MAG: hypothetical protein Q9181_005899 [Wetmoreana brouardii]
MDIHSGLGRLPAELIRQIIGDLAEEEPSSRRELTQEPSVHVLHNDTKGLKNLSLTCRTLRFLTFKPLFRYLRVGIKAFSADATLGKSAEPNLEPLRNLSRFIEHELSDKILGLAIFFPVQCSLGQHHLADFVSKLGDFVLEMNPEIFTLIGPPKLLGDMMDLTVDETDEWAFGRKVHVISMRQASELADAATISKQTTPPTSIAHLRPWHDVSINEGSCLSAYSTYEYHTKTTPSILHTHSGWQWSRLLAATLPFLRHLDYVSIFPLPDHIGELGNVILSCPRLATLSTQFTPAHNARGNILEDRARVGKANISDVWMETMASYRVLAKQIWTYGHILPLLKWTCRDKKIEFDDLVRPILRGWEMRELCVWERVWKNFADAESSTSPDSP